MQRYNTNKIDLWHWEKDFIVLSSGLLNKQPHTTFWVSLERDCNHCFSVKLTQNPPTTLGGNKKRDQEKSNLSRKDSNHRGIRVSFTKKSLTVTYSRDPFLLHGSFSNYI